MKTTILNGLLEVQSTLLKILLPAFFIYQLQMFGCSKVEQKSIGQMHLMDNLGNPDMNPPPFFIQRVELKIGDREFNDISSVHMENSVFEEYLKEPYQVFIIAFEDVHYWTRDEMTFFYFTYDHGLVGFRGHDQIDWIRVL